MDNIQERIGEFNELWSIAATQSEKNKVYRLMIDSRPQNALTYMIIQGTLDKNQDQ